MYKRNDVVWIEGKNESRLGVVINSDKGMVFVGIFEVGFLRLKEDKLRLAGKGFDKIWWVKDGMREIGYRFFSRGSYCSKGRNGMWKIRGYMRKWKYDDEEETDLAFM